MQNNFMEGNKKFIEGDFKGAMASFKLALNDTDDKNKLAVLSANIGTCYNAIDEYKLAIEYANKSLSILKEIKSKNMFLLHEAYYILGQAYYYLKDYKKALLNLNTSSAYDGGMDKDCEDGIKEVLKCIQNKDNDDNDSWDKWF